MTQSEYYYRKMMGALGMTMLLFLLLMNVMGVIVSFFLMLAPSGIAGTVVYQLLYGAGYMAAFLLPIPCFRAMTKKFGHIYRPVYSHPRMSPYFPLILFAGVAVIFAAANVNAAFVSVFDYSTFSSEILWEDPAAMAPYELVLHFLVVCLVPGICEELLFRGAILTNCLPFGRSKAIFISALLFALMHQNIEQIFYAFVAGILLGIVYEYTGSIWNCVLLHTLNNFTSVFSEVIMAKFKGSAKGYLGMLIFESVIFFLGAISIAILIVRFFSKRKDFGDGVFGAVHPASDHYAIAPVSAKRSVRLFLTPSMIIFLGFALFQMLLLLLMAVLYGIFGA